MLALIVARPGPVNDGLVALLDAAPQVRKIVHVRTASDAWDFVNTVCPDITLIHTPVLTQEIATFMGNYKARCRSPLLAIVSTEEARQTAVAHGADTAVIEGLQSSRLAAQIAKLLHQSEV